MRKLLCLLKYQYYLNMLLLILHNNNNNNIKHFNTLNRDNVFLLRDKFVGSIVKGT